MVFDAASTAGAVGDQDTEMLALSEAGSTSAQQPCSGPFSGWGWGRALQEWCMPFQLVTYLVSCGYMYTHSFRLAPRGTHGSQWMLAEGCKTRLD